MPKKKFLLPKCSFSILPASYLVKELEKMADHISESEFSKLIHEHQGIIRKVCAVYGRTEAEREDLSQEILIRLWKGLPSFREQSRISTWMYRVALNTAISQQRKHRRQPRFESLPEHPISEPVDSGGEVEKEQISALYCAIGQLKAVEKAIILLYLEEHSYEEIAEITGLSKSNVSVKLVRIRRKLEKIIHEILNRAPQ